MSAVLQTFVPASTLAFGPISMTSSGRIDWKEFMDGAIRLKGQAKSLDSWLMSGRPETTTLRKTKMEPQKGIST